MPNSIRTPKPGRTAASRRIAEAVDNEAWQEFRVSLKGKPTLTKIAELSWYYHYGPDDWETRKIRVDNYLKALARGGQVVLTGPFQATPFVFEHVQIKKEK